MKCDDATLVPLPRFCESFQGGAFYEKICHLGSLCPVSIGPLQEGLWQSGLRNGRDFRKRLIIIDYLIKHPETVKAFKKEASGSLIGMWPLRAWPGAYCKWQQLHAVSIGHHSSSQLEQL